MTKFSAIIVSYNSWPHTLRCVAALYGTGYEDFEVLVVDNGQEPPPDLPASRADDPQPGERGFRPGL